MKILFIGLGSIGTRHLRNMATILQERREPLEVHALRGTTHLLSTDISSLVQKQISRYEDLDAAYDAIFITNPTVLHYETLKKILSKAKKIFIEKPVFSSVNIDFAALNIPQDTICYVAAPLRYTKVFEHLKRIAGEKRIYSVRAICSSYLPDWRPMTNYRECYSASKKNGGDVGLELIHEWDYLVELFGFPQRMRMLSGKYSDLEISSDDIAIYIAEYKTMLVSLSLDYFGRSRKREIELYCDDDVIVGDFVKSEIHFLKSDKAIRLPEERDSYQIRELEYFLSLSNEECNQNSISHAFDVLKIAKGIIG